MLQYSVMKDRRTDRSGKVDERERYFWKDGQRPRQGERTTRGKNRQFISPPFPYLCEKPGVSVAECNPSSEVTM